MDNAYSVHSLVHSWSRDSEQRREGYFFAHNLLSSLIDLIFACEDYTFRRTLVPHIKPASQRDALLGTSMAYDDEQCTNYGPVFFEVGYWNEREQLEVPVVGTEKKVFREEHPDMLMSMANLVSTYWNQGRWKEAEQLDAKSTKGVLGEEHQDALTSTVNLTLTYSNQGRWKEAKQLQVQVSEARKTVALIENAVNLLAKHLGPLCRSNHLCSPFVI